MKIKRIPATGVLLALTIFMTIIAANLFAQDDFRKVNQKAFKPGEKLTFEINYGFITAGEAIMEIDPVIATMNGRKCFDIKFSVNSTESFDMVYKVRDYYKTYVDMEGLFPWRFEQHIRKAKTYTGENRS